jgi:hypothetical protein
VLKTPDNINFPENFFQTQIFSIDQPNVDKSKKAELLKRNVSKEIDIFRKILCENNSKTITDSHSTCQFWLKNKEKLSYLRKLALLIIINEH